MQKFVSVNTPTKHLVSGRLTQKLYRRRVADFDPDPARAWELAKQWQASARVSLSMGHEPDMTSTDPITTFGDLAEQAVPIVFAGNRDRVAIGTNVTRLCDWFGKQAINQIAKQDLVQMCDAMRADGLSTSTIQHRLSKFNRIMEFAVDRGMINDRPVYRYRGQHRSRERVFTQAECDRLIAGLYEQGNVYVEFATVLLWLGSRYGETAGLLWSDIDDDFIGFRAEATKTSKARTIPLRGPAKAAIESAWLDRGHEPGPFHQLRTHKVFYRRWNVVKADMGLSDDRDFTPHSLRHTCMTRLASNGLSLAQLKAWGGWKSYSMVARFEHIESGHDLRAAVDSHAHNI